MDEGPRGWGVPLYERVLAGAEPGTPVLDVGCGPGTFTAFAAGRGLVVSGADTDRSALAVAERSVPDADLRCADAHDLPWPDATFGLVALVQVLEHVTNPVAALREAGRLCGPGGRVRATVWGRADECEIGAIGAALAPFLPDGAAGPGRAGSDPRKRSGIGRSGSGQTGSGQTGSGQTGSGRSGIGRSGAEQSAGAGRGIPGSARGTGTGRASSLLASRTSGPPPLTEPERLRKLAGLAGLRVGDLREVECTFVYADADELVGSVLDSGPGRRAVLRSSGPRVVRRALLSGLEPFRDGTGYRLRNTFRVLDAAPPDPL